MGWLKESGLAKAHLFAMVAAGLAAAALAGAPAASAGTVIVHSAGSGELRGDRLILHGVNPRVSYATSSGRAGTESVRRVHRRVFVPGKPATGTLHVAGHHGGDEPTFRLSRPRYSAARDTVSYRARPLDNKRLPGGTARAAGIPARRFGAASLSIVPHTALASGSNGGNDCYALINNEGGFNAADLELQSSSNWDTDSWASGSPPSSIEINGTAAVESDGGLWRGCSQTTVWTRAPGGRAPTGTFTITVTWPWTQLPTSTCTTDQPDWYRCRRDDSNGAIVWDVEATRP
ncbi:MAG TPA: hypothetical protein VGF25_08580 [Thermoleophilaceae bacterium]